MEFDAAVGEGGFGDDGEEVEDVDRAFGWHVLAALHGGAYDQHGLLFVGVFGDFQGHALEGGDGVEVGHWVGVDDATGGGGEEVEGVLGDLGVEGDVCEGIVSLVYPLQ